MNKKKQTKKYKADGFFMSVSYDAISSGSYRDATNVKCNIVLMTPGVYNNDFFSEETLEEYVAPPLPIPVTWQHVSHKLSKDYKLYYDECVGNVFDVSHKENSVGICGVAVLNIPAMRRKVPDHLVDKLLEGDPLGVSIGIYANFEQIEYDGKIIDKVTDFFIDHVAILDQNDGACSLKDGCGINKEGEFMLKKARTPDYDGVEDVAWGSVKKNIGDYVKSYYKFSGEKEPETVSSRVKDMPISEKSWIASKTLLGDENATDSRDLVFFPVVNPATNKLNYNALLAVKSGRGQSADIAEDTLKTVIDKANFLLDKEFNKDFNNLETGDSEMKKEKNIETKEVEKDIETEIENEIDSEYKKEEVVDEKKDTQIAKEFSDEDYSFYKEMRNKKIAYLLEKVFNNEVTVEKSGLDKLSLVSLDKIANKILEFSSSSEKTVSVKKESADKEDVDYAKMMKKSDSGQAKEEDDKAPEMPKMPWLRKVS